MQYRNSSYSNETFNTYWFEKNLQGDIVAVYNEGGTKLVSYTYDAWGNVTTTYHNGGASNDQNDEDTSLEEISDNTSSNK